MLIRCIISACAPKSWRPAEQSILSLMRSLGDAEGKFVKRYKCGCGCEGCICAAEPTVADDAGRDVTLGELCQRLEKNLQAFGDLSRVEARPEELATMRIPCPCEDSSCG